VSYGNQDGSSPPDPLAASDPQPGTTAVTDEKPAAVTDEKPAAAPAAPVAPAGMRVPASGPAGGQSRPIVLLGGATAVLLVLGLVMTGLFVFKSNQQTETRDQLATAQAALAARDEKSAAASKKLADVKSQLADAQQQLADAQKAASTTKANQVVIGQCLTLVTKALTTARSGTSNQLDAALKKLKTPCARADKLA
jgi:predicted cobalt transporter CbtA